MVIESYSDDYIRDHLGRDELGADVILKLAERQR
jgi:hypothetical protein